MPADGKIRRLAQLCQGKAGEDDLLALARLAELTEFAGGSVIAPAGVAGLWRTRVLSGSIATTVPARRHAEGDVLVHGPDTALLAVTDAVLLTAAEHVMGAVDRLVPGLLAAPAARVDAEADAPGSVPGLQEGARPAGTSRRGMSDVS